jgi:chromosome segregation ATPase
MIDINITTIEERIKETNIELAMLQQSHDAMLAAYQQKEQEFRKRVGENQSRFQQLQGALKELERLRGQFEQKPPSDGQGQPPQRESILIVPERDD